MAIPTATFGEAREAAEHQWRASSAAEAADGASRTRVLHIIENLNYGGMERLLADLVRRADPERFESHVLVLQFLGRFSEGLEPYATLHQAPPQPRWSMIWPGTLARVIRSIAPGVVHTHSGVWYKATLAARVAGVPRIVHTDHGRASPDPWLARTVDRLAARRTDVVAAVSDALARQLAATVVGDAARIQVVHNGVDTELHRPSADDGTVRAEFGIPPGAPLLGSIGRLEPIKGYDIMIEAFARLCASWPGDEPPHLLVAGDGSQREALLRAAREGGISHLVHLPGWRDDVGDLHSAFSLFTMSSRSEGTSVSLLEAMSAGVCPVVTDVGGNAAVLGAALRHRLVPPRDPDALAAAWIDALRGSEARAQDAESARSRVIEAFSLRSMVERYQQLYLGEA